MGRLDIHATVYVDPETPLSVNGSGSSIGLAVGDRLSGQFLQLFIGEWSKRDDGTGAVIAVDRVIAELQNARAVMLRSLGRLPAAPVLATEPRNPDDDDESDEDAERAPLTRLDRVEGWANTVAREAGGGFDSQDAAGAI